LQPTLLTHPLNHTTDELCYCGNNIDTPPQTSNDESGYKYNKKNIKRSKSLHLSLSLYNYLRLKLWASVCRVGMMAGARLAHGS
jgi:hypothetical protein